MPTQALLARLAGCSRSSFSHASLPSPYAAAPGAQRPSAPCPLAAPPATTMVVDQGALGLPWRGGRVSRARARTRWSYWAGRCRWALRRAAGMARREAWERARRPHRPGRPLPLAQKSLLATAGRRCRRRTKAVFLKSGAQRPRGGCCRRGRRVLRPEQKLQPRAVSPLLARELTSGLRHKEGRSQASR